MIQETTQPYAFRLVAIDIVFFFLTNLKSNAHCEWWLLRLYNTSVVTLLFALQELSLSFYRRLSSYYCLSMWIGLRSTTLTIHTQKALINYHQFHNGPQTRSLRHFGDSYNWGLIVTWSYSLLSGWFDVIVGEYNRWSIGLVLVDPRKLTVYHLESEGRWTWRPRQSRRVGRLPCHWPYEMECSDWRSCIRRSGRNSLWWNCAFLHCSF